MSKEKVLKFLSDHNKPFTLNDIVQGLGDQSGKSKVQNILDKLIEEDEVIMKVYGKQKIYCKAQNENVPANKVSENVLVIERECSNLALKLKDVDDQLQKNTVESRDLEGTMSKTEALKRKGHIKAEIEDLKKKIADIKEKSYSKEESAAISKDYSTIFTEYKKRKRLCTDMIDAIFENYPKSKKNLLQEMSVETDDEVGFKINIQPK